MFYENDFLSPLPLPLSKNVSTPPHLIRNLEELDLGGNQLVVLENQSFTGLQGVKTIGKQYLVFLPF